MQEQYVCQECGGLTPIRLYLNGSSKNRCLECHNRARYAVLTDAQRLELHDDNCEQCEFDQCFTHNPDWTKHAERDVLVGIATFNPMDEMYDD